MWAGLSIGLLGLGVARNWANLMRKWKQMECAMEAKYEIPKNFRLKLYALMGVVVIIIFRKFLYGNAVEMNL